MGEFLGSPYRGNTEHDSGTSSGGASSGGASSGGTCSGGACACSGGACSGAVGYSIAVCFSPPSDTTAAWQCFVW